MDIKKIGLILGVLVLTFLAGKFSSKPEVRIEKVEVVKEVIKEVKNNNVVTEIEEKVLPDKTLIKTTKITDLSTSNKEAVKESKKESLTVEKNKPQWLFGGGTGFNSRREQIYSLEANTRILKLPAYVGVQVIGNQKEQAVLGKILVEF